MRLLMYSISQSFHHIRLGTKVSKWFTSATCLTICQSQVQEVEEQVLGECKSTIEVLQQWGCSDDDISKILSRRPSLHKADLDQLQFKLGLLSGLGITGPDLVRMLNCRPRFLSCRINHCFDERLAYFRSLFESKETLRKAIVRNPSLLTYDFHDKIKPVISLYEELGIKRKDLIIMLLSRPTMIPRTSFDDEKFEYIRKTGVCKDSRMYKYIVTLIGISCLDTIRLKVANLEKFGFHEDEVLSLFGKSPYLLTLSIDKVQRNMTFVVGTMKLPARVVIGHPYLLFNNLDTVLKPRTLLAQKMHDMNLNVQLKGVTLVRAMRMKEERFLEVLLKHHPEEVASELMEFYSSAKEVKRLAQSSKRYHHKGFPF